MIKQQKIILPPIDSEISNYKLLISYGIDSSIFNDLTTEGSIVVFDMNGNLLNREISLYDQENEKIEIWVNLESYPINGTFVVVRWNCSQQLLSRNENVWGGYGGVWHLNEITGNFINSANELTFNRSTSIAVSGVINNGQYRGPFSRTNDEKIEWGNESGAIIVFCRSTAVSVDNIVAKRLSGVGGKGYNLRFNNGKLQFEMDDDVQNPYIITTDSTYQDGIWHFVVAGRDNNTLKMSVDGIHLSPVSDDGMDDISQDNALVIGTSETRSVDELRILKGSYPSSTEIEAMYSNYKLGGLGWYSVGKLTNINRHNYQGMGFKMGISF